MRKALHLRRVFTLCAVFTGFALTSAVLSKPQQLTFIVPTSGRLSLEQTIASLLAQDSGNWLALIVFSDHGLHRAHRKAACPAFAQDTRITCYRYTERVYGNCAGSIRNLGIALSRTQWVAFVDDDDILSSTYTSSFISEVNQQPKLDLLVFRMYDHRYTSNVKVIPPPDAKNIVRNYVGISFAFKRSDSAADYFVESTTEDYDFIFYFCLDPTKHCIISKYVEYYVKGMAPSTELRQVGESFSFHTVADVDEAHATFLYRASCLNTDITSDGANGNGETLVV